MTQEQVDKIRVIIGTAIGQASMAWNPRPSFQVYNSEEAVAIVDKAVTDVIMALTYKPAIKDK